MTRKRQHTKRLQLLGLAALLFVLVAGLSAVPVIHQAELRLTDTYFRVAPAPRSSSQVVLVLIDDESLRDYGRWPWSRTLLAQMTTNLAQGGASAIGLDVLLSEPQSAEADAQLRDAFAAAGRVVIVDKIGTYADGVRWVEPLPELTRAVAAVGHAQAVQDIDGVCRRFPPLELTPDGPRWAFAVEMARRTGPEQAAQFLRDYGIRADEGELIAIARATTVPVAYRRGGFQTISAAAVLRNHGLESVRGRPVLVGFGASELGDRISTPLTGELPAPGVEVHGQILDGILSGRRAHDVPLWFAAVIVLGICIVAIAVFHSWHGWTAVGLVVTLGALLYACGLAIFVWTSRIVPVGSMLLAVVIGPLLVYTADFVAIERSVTGQLRELRRWLSGGRGEERAPNADLSWRLALLQNLQAELGGRYELHRALLEASHDPIAMFDHTGALLLSNEPLKQLYGGEPEVIPSLQELRAALRPSEEAPLVRDGESEEGEGYLKGELYAVRIVPMPATSGAPAGGTIVTLTSLRARVERDRARAEALGFITHELRTPLMAIQGFAQLMTQYPESPANATAPETIFRESRRLLALVNGYLDVLRMDAGARPLASEPVELRNNVQQVFSILQPLAEARRIRLRLAGDSALYVDGDEALISGAVLNLVSNAIKYGEAGSEISVRCSAVQGQAVVSVHNVGATIAADELQQVFAPFYRAPAAEKNHAGWGLGLAFVKRIAEKHGGSVTASSDDTGTTFEFRLPACLPVAAAGGSP